MQLEELMGLDKTIHYPLIYTKFLTPPELENIKKNQPKEKIEDLLSDLNDSGIGETSDTDYEDDDEVLSDLDNLFQIENSEEIIKEPTIPKFEEETNYSLSEIMEGNELLNLYYGDMVECGKFIFTPESFKTLNKYFKRLWFVVPNKGDSPIMIDRDFIFKNLVYFM